MTYHEAYLYAFGLMTGYYWATGQNKDLGQILSEMTLWYPLANGKTPSDPAFTHDWLNAVEKVTKKNSLTNTEALQVTVYFLKEFNDHQGFELGKVMDFLNNLIDKHIAAEKTWKSSC